MVDIKNKILHKKILSIAVIIIGIFIIIYSKENNKIIGINGHKFNVIIADTNQKRELGLGNRRNLCEKCGMLFLFENKKKLAFWMKDMQFNIDIIWIRDNIVIDIVNNVSYKTPEKKIYSPENINQVLELSAGSAEKFGIIPGSSVQYIK